MIASVLAGGLLPLINVVPAAASSHAVSAPTSVNAMNTQAYIPVVTGGDLKLSGYSDDPASPTRVTIEATNGQVKVVQTAALTIAPGYNFGPAATIAFFGVQSAINNALASLEFQGTAGGAASIKVTAGVGSGLVNPDNDHYYEVITASKTWAQAKAAAAARTVPGCGGTCTGYLVTVTSAAENTFVQDKVKADTWMGLSDDFGQVNAAVGSTLYANQAAAEGRFHWIAGPEAGTLVSVGNGTPVAQGGEYENWANVEPNNAGAEHYGQMYTAGGWNDLPASSTLSTYVIEYGGVPAGVPTTASSVATRTVNLTVSSVPSAPVITAAVPGAGSIDFTVTAPTSNGGAAIDDYEYTLDNGATWISLNVNVLPSPVSIAGLTGGVEQLVRFRALNTNGAGAMSNLVHAAAETPAAPVLPPTIDQLTRGNGQLTMTYTPAPSDGGSAITDHEYSIDDGASWVSLGSANPTSPFTITGLTNGKLYPLRLRAINGTGGIGNGKGVWSNMVPGVPATVPSAPTINSASVSGNDVTVSFVAPSSHGGALITSYQYSLDDGTTWTTTSPALPEGTSFVISGVANGSHNVRLRAVNDVGPGPGSNSQGVWVGPVPVPAATPTPDPAPPVQDPPAEPEPAERTTSVERVSGPDRFTTAGNLAQEYFEPGLRTVYIARDDNFPDALAGTPLAYADDAPILLVGTNQIPRGTAETLRALKPQRIVILGGRAAVSATVADGLQDYAAELERLSGKDRFDTAAEISRRRFPEGTDTVILATGETYPDALSVGAAAANQNIGVLLASKGELPGTTARELARLKPKKVYVLGGTAALDQSVVAAVTRATGVDPQRIAGRNRYETGAAVSRLFYRANRHATFVATGEDFTDALTAGPIAARVGAPVVIVPPQDLPSRTAKELQRLSPRRLVVVGGTAAVSDAQEQRIRGVLGQER